MGKLSAMMSISVTTIQRWESGSTYPATDSVKTMEHYTKITGRDWANWIASKNGQLSTRT